MEALCPYCKTNVLVNERDVGKLATCPLCNNLFHLARKDKNPLFCDNCHCLLGEGAKICIQCGYNIETAQCIESKIEREYDRFPLWRKGLVLLYDIFPGLFRPVHIILFVASIIVALLLVYLGLLMLSFGALLAAIMLGAFGMMVYAQGVVFLLSTRLEFMNQAFVEIEGTQWTIFIVMVFGPALALFFLIVSQAPETG